MNEASHTKLEVSFVVDTIYSTIDTAVLVRDDIRWPVFLSRVIMGPNPYTTYIARRDLSEEAGIQNLPTDPVEGIALKEGPPTSIFAQVFSDKKRNNYPVTSNQVTLEVPQIRIDRKQAGTMVSEPRTTQPVFSSAYTGDRSVEWPAQSSIIQEDIDTVRQRCQEKGYGEDCLHFEKLEGVPPDSGSPELICYFKGQKEGEILHGIRPEDAQIHNEFMVTNCQQNVYTEYLLLFKYAVWDDVEQIYKKFIQEGYVIYKPPTEFKDYEI